jgi:hypothetical protein
MFTKAVCACFDRGSHFLGRLTKLKQTGLVADFITTFELLATITEGLSWVLNGFSLSTDYHRLLGVIYEIYS